jgi:hypothetical protein
MRLEIGDRKKFLLRFFPFEVGIPSMMNLSNSTRRARFQGFTPALAPDCWTIKRFKIEQVNEPSTRFKIL